VRRYAYEPTPSAFACLQFNLTINRRKHVRLFNEAADSRTLGSILSASHETSIDFLKMDCEGCEYSVLLGCPKEILAKVKRISMEIHDVGSQRGEEIFTKISMAGFQVRKDQKIGDGH